MLHRSFLLQSCVDLGEYLVQLHHFLAELLRSDDERRAYKYHILVGICHELLSLEPLIRTEGEKYLYELNRAALLYDMRKFRQAADIVLEIPSFNPEMDARCAQLKTKIMEAM